MPVHRALMRFSRSFTLAAIAAVLLAGAGLIWLAVKTGLWDRWRSHSYTGRAAALQNQGLREAANQALIEAIRLNPRNVDAWRLTLLVRPDQSLDQQLLTRSQIADLDPSDAANLEQLAIGCMLDDRPTLAGKAIQGLLTLEGETDRVLELRARHAAALGARSTARDIAIKLLQRTPDHRAARFIVALGDCTSSDPQEAAAAVATLQEMADDPLFHLEACRSLVRFHLAKGDHASAFTWAQKAASDPGAGFGDHLAVADLASKLDPGALPEQAEALARRIGDDPAAYLKLAAWLGKSGRADVLETLASKAGDLGLNGAAVAIAQTQGYAQTADWERMEKMLENANWGGGEPLRLAYLARAQRALSKNDTAKATWLKAGRAAVGRPETAKALAGIVAHWAGWEAEYEDFLWRAQKESPDQLRWTMKELFDHYFAEKSSQGMLRVSRAMADADPASEAIQNNVTYFSILRGQNLEAAHHAAAALNLKHPKDPIVAATFALSAIVSRKPAEAMKALERLEPGDLARRELALVHAIALKGVGRAEQARNVAATINPAELFAEERELLAASGLLTPAPSAPRAE